MIHDLIHVSTKNEKQNPLECKQSDTTLPCDRQLQQHRPTIEQMKERSRCAEKIGQREATQTNYQITLCEEE